MVPLISNQSKTVKGALVLVASISKTSVNDLNPPSFVFQYNPEILTHTFSSPNNEEEAKKEKRKSSADKIVEMINLNLELDATDQHEQPNLNQKTVKCGLHPDLAALESILLSQTQSQNSAPVIVLFIWGPNRSIPVSVENARLIEEAFDTQLNPIRVKIELAMRVLDLSEFEKGSLGHILCLNHSVRRKVFIQKYVENEFYRDFLKSIPNNVLPKSHLSKTQHKFDIK